MTPLSLSEAFCVPVPYFTLPKASVTSLMVTFLPCLMQSTPQRPMATQNDTPLSYPGRSRSSQMMDCLLVGKGCHQLEAVGYLSRQRVVLGSLLCMPTPWWIMQCVLTDWHNRSVMVATFCPVCLGLA